LVLVRVAIVVAVGLLVAASMTFWASIDARWVAAVRDSAARSPDMGGAAAILGGVGGFAGFIPAWRASPVDPAEELRDG
jgi:ABC-type antimicrobial peptide transport system permease subunit